MFIGASIKNRALDKWPIKSALLLIPLLICQNVIAKAPSPQSELSHTLGELVFTLNNASENCELHVRKSQSDSESKTIPLLLEAPCYWVTRETKALLHYSYEAIDVDNTLLIAGTTLDWPAEKKTYHKIPGNTFCSQYLQGVVVTKGEVHAVDEKMIAAHCESGLGMDEKVFYAIAHNPKRYQEKIEGSADQSPETVEDKSLFNTITDSLKGLFSGESEDDKKPN